MPEPAEGTVLNPGDGTPPGPGDPAPGDKPNEPGDSWTDGLPDEVKALFGDAESLDAFKESMPKAVEVPEAYEAPEGVEIDASEMEAFTPVAKELGLSQEQVAGLVKYQVEQSKALPALLQTQAHEAMLEGLKTFRSEVGKEKYDVVVGHALNSMKIVHEGVPGFKEWSDKTQMGDHPMLVRAFGVLGSKFSEDTFNPGGGPKDGEKTHAEILYPNQGGS